MGGGGIQYKKLYTFKANLYMNVYHFPFNCISIGALYLSTQYMNRFPFQYGQLLVCLNTLLSIWLGSTDTIPVPKIITS